MEDTNKVVVKDGIGHLDRVITSVSLSTIDFWHSIGATPNTLTTLGLISSILCLYFLYHKNAKLSVLFLILRCYFDYSDGLLARKYRQTSEFGDWYDHIVDWSFTLGLFSVIYLKSENRLLHLSVLFLFSTLFSMQMGCIEKEYKYHNDKETSISKLRHICNNPELMKFFDNGTLYVVMIVIIVIISNQNNK